jgi:hypothetical protein
LVSFGKATSAESKLTSPENKTFASAPASATGSIASAARFTAKVRHKHDALNLSVTCVTVRPVPSTNYSIAGPAYLGGWSRPCRRPARRTLSQPSFTARTSPSSRIRRRPFATGFPDQGFRSRLTPSLRASALAGFFSRHLVRGRAGGHPIIGDEPSEKLVLPVIFAWKRPDSSELVAPRGLRKE